MVMPPIMSLPSQDMEPSLAEVQEQSFNPAPPLMPTAPSLAPLVNPQGGWGNSVGEAGGFRMPNAATLGADPMTTALITAVVPGAGYLNMPGNIYNTVANAELARNVGAPLTFGQQLGGILGFNNYAGTAADTLNALYSTEFGRAAMTSNQADGTAVMPPERSVFTPGIGWQAEPLPDYTIPEFSPLSLVSVEEARPSDYEQWSDIRDIWENYDPGATYGEYHRGGMVHARRGAPRDVPIMAQAGEYVLNPIMTARIGKEALDKINRGKVKASEIKKAAQKK